MAPTETTDVTARPVALDLGLTILGAIAGGVIGFFGYEWLLRQGLYALPLPGMLLGLGAGLASRRRNLTLAVCCGIVGLVPGIMAEWHTRPFIKDPSLGYFLSHLADLRSATLILIALGGFCGFYFALGRNK